MNQYICDDDDLNCLHDYLVAAINGDDISELPRLWNQEIGVIRSRPYQSERDKVLDVQKKIIEDMYLLKFTARREGMEAVSLWHAQEIVKQRIGCFLRGEP